VEKDEKGSIRKTRCPLGGGIFGSTLKTVGMRGKGGKTRSTSPGLGVRGPALDEREGKRENSQTIQNSPGHMTKIYNEIKWKAQSAVERGEKMFRILPVQERRRTKPPDLEWEERFGQTKNPGTTGGKVPRV